MTVNDISNRKTAIFSLKPVHEQMNVSDRYRALGNNTGNIVFDTALSELIDADRVYWDTPPDVLAQYDRFITTSYIWIRQNTPIPGILEPAGDRPLIPMSEGLQANDYDPGFQIHPEVVADLKKIEERCTIGCRGEYTAEILNRHGIRDLMVIGCPSVYAGIESGTFVRSLPSCKPQHAVSNFSTFWRKLKEHEARFLKYLAENRFSFIEQTAGELKEAVVNGQPVDPKREYTVATIDYLAEGNDRMPAFRSAKLKTCPENMVLRDLLIDYIKECESEGHLVKTGVEGRIKVL